MFHRLPSKHIKLDFNPLESENETLRQVFTDPIARTLYSLIKSTSLTDSHFPRACLNASEHIGEKGMPENPHDLEIILTHYLGRPWRDAGPLSHEILPYLQGEQTITYYIKKDF